MMKIKVVCDGVCVYEDWKYNTPRIELFERWLYQREEDEGKYPNSNFFIIFNKDRSKEVILNRNKISAVIFER